MDWFQIGKGVGQGCILILSPCLFNFCAEYTTQNARLEDSQAEIKIARRIIDNLIYADDSTLMTESEEELKRVSRWGWKRRVKKLAWDSTFKKLRSWHPVPSFHVNRWGKSGNKAGFIFLSCKITADGDCSHEIKRHLLLGRKAMTNVVSIFKSRDITLPTKYRLIKAIVFPAVMYGCESWTIKKAECWRTDAFKLWCWRRHLRVPWTSRRSN